MLNRLRDLLKHQTGRNVLINTLGNYLNIFFVAFFALLLTRILSVEAYGVLSVLLGIAYVLSNILDFGTTATIYSYLPGLLEKKHEGRNQLYVFIKSTFFYQSLFSFIVIAVLFFTFPWLDKVFFKTDAPPTELYLTAISVLFFIWQYFVLNIMFAAKHYFKANMYLNLANVIKTLLIFVMMGFGKVTVGSVIFVFGIVGPVIFFLMLFMERRELFFVLAKSAVRKEEVRFGYTLTYFVGSQFFNLGLRMDLFLLSFFRSKAEVGLYGLSQKIILTIITTIISITQVLSPAFSRVKTKADARQQLKTAFFYLLIPAGLFLIVFLLPDWVFTLFFTDKFEKTAGITKALALPFAIYAIGNIPLLFVLYSVKKPIYILISYVLFFLILTGGCLMLIPKLGVYGPPYAITAAMVVSHTILGIVAFVEYKKLPTTISANAQE